MEQDFESVTEVLSQAELSGNWLFCNEFVFDGRGKPAQYSKCMNTEHFLHSEILTLLKQIFACMAKMWEQLFCMDVLTVLLWERGLGGCSFLV